MNVFISKRSNELRIQSHNLLDALSFFVYINGFSMEGSQHCEAFSFAVSSSSDSLSRYDTNSFSMLTASD